MRRARSAALLLFCLGTSVLMNFAVVASPFEGGDDGSRAWAATTAAASKMRFGAEIVFSHGPLGYLTDRCPPIGKSVAIAAFGSMLAALLAGAGVYGWVSGLAFKSPAVPWALAYAATASLAVSHPHTENNFFMTVIVLLFSAFYNRKFAFPSLIAAAFLAGAFTLIKLSLGIATGGAVAATAVFLGEGRRKILLRLGTALGVAALSTLAVWCAVGQSPFDLPAYIINSKAVVAGYPFSLAMSVPGGELMALDYVLSVGLLSFAVWNMEHGKPVRLLAALLFPLFVAYKHSVVRMGPFHVFHFPTIMQLVLIGFLFHAIRRKEWRALPYLLLAAYLIQWGPFRTAWAESIKGRSVGRAYFRAATESPKSGWSEFKKIGRIAEIESNAKNVRSGEEERYRMPASWLQKIAASGTDVWSPDLAPIFVNALTYAPRPTLTTILAASRRADDLDEAHLRSNRAAPFILTDRDIIGGAGEHLFWTEPKSFRTLFSLYDYAGTDKTLILLERRAADKLVPPPAAVRAETDESGRVDVPAVKAGELLYASFQVRASFLQKAREFLYKPHIYAAEVVYDNGAVIEFTFYPVNTAHGLLINPLPYAEPQVDAFLKERTGPTVKSVRFYNLTAGKIPMKGMRLEWMPWSPVEPTGAVPPER